MTFEVSGNPLIHGEASEHCMCHWHAAVFARLYDALVARGLICTETACMAQHSSPVCRFELGFENTPPVQNMIEIKEQHADTV
jgi:divinyl protochlorophyllide a 8-vinyl-reductase